MGKKYVDLEIGLHRWDADRYRIDLRFSRPDSDTDEWLIRNGPEYVRFDIKRLSSLWDDAAYGKLLGEQLFASQEVQAAFRETRAVAHSQDSSLRIRLFIGPSAPELHDLRWETLRDPQDASSLLTTEHLLFSRYLSSADWRPVRLRPQSTLRALVVISDPVDIEEYQMAPLKEFKELDQAKLGLGDMYFATLLSGGSATLKNLIATLRNDEPYDILYIIAHGKIIDDEPRLWLEDEQEMSDLVSGQELVIQLKELVQRPRLVVLASCQSAGTGQEPQPGEARALIALGPHLAEAGIPAVIAMQGNMSVETVKEFMPVFFKELQRDGQIDRAIAVARGTVRKQPDWWMPVLFMRLKSGKIWYVPGFAEEHEKLKKWPAFLKSIRKKYCTPILGPGLSDSLLGSRRELAWRWAENHHFPMASHYREDLPQVAQYLAIDQSPRFLRESFVEHIHEELWNRYKDKLSPDLEQSSLYELLDNVGERHREDNPQEPYKVLAELPFPIYIITTPGNLLEGALSAAGKEPRVELCRWNDDIEYPSIYDEDPDYQPDVDQPLVYHLFGCLQNPQSLILTEDDYFDYLIGLTRKETEIPDVVLRALTDTALLFLGFEIDDWYFRVLFRSIIKREGVRKLRDYAHVAAQINPEEGRVMEPERARRYLKQYFYDAQEEAPISIYWGSVEDFVQGLHNQYWEKKGGAV